jgi:hypothetical protein
MLAVFSTQVKLNCNLCRKRGHKSVDCWDYPRNINKRDIMIPKIEVKKNNDDEIVRVYNDDDDDDNKKHAAKDDDTNYYSTRIWKRQELRYIMHSSTKVFETFERDIL